MAEDKLTARLRAAMTPLAENDAVSPEVFAEVCDAHLAVADFFAARLSASEQALTELANVPDAGPFPNKGACRAFAGYVQGVARAALAGREETGGG